MADMVPVEEVADAMYKLVDDSKGMKKWKATDLQKAAIEMFGSDRCDKKLCKLAIKELINSGRLVYTYFGGSYIEVPHTEGAAND
jgi:hypothetical protein